MHICYLCDEYPPGLHGGVGSVTQTLARAFVHRGHQATVVGSGRVARDVEENDQGVRVIRLAPTRIRGGGLLVNGWRLRRVLAQIHQQSPISLLEGPEFSLASVSKGLGIRTAIRMNGGHHFFSVTLGRQPRLKRSWIEKRSFARADHLCAVSRFVADTTLDLLRQTERRVEILPNIVDVSLFSPPPDDQTVDGLIVFAGTVCEKKGVRQLVQAMPHIVRHVPQAAVWIVGRDSRDPETGASYTDEVRRLVPPELSERVIFKGPVDHKLLPGILAKASLCIYPSHMEALPLAWLEGMAMQKAVVGSKTGPGPEVIEHERSGLLCDPHDPRSIADAVVRALKDPELRRRLAEGARRRTVEQFSERAVIAQNEAFYARCM